MKIVILGAGQVGGTLVENLVREENDITLVDIDNQRLRTLQNRFDIRTVTGPASYPSVLRQAGVNEADMLIAVTSNDETNLLACHIAYKLFHTPTKIARIRSPRYLDDKDKLFGDDGFRVDVFINPEQLVTDYVANLIEYPHALQVLDFADGKVRLVGVRPYFGGALVGKSLADLKVHLPNYNARVAAIYRGNRSITLSGETVIEIGDEVFFVAASNHIHDVMSALRRAEKPYKNIMIAGGGNIGERLALALEQQHQVKVIDHNVERSRHIANRLNKTTVLLGDASDRELLINEGIDSIDVFCAVTNDDEVNIMSCMQAKRLGARQVLALINRTAYVDLIEASDVDIAISPQQATISSILPHIRRGDIVNVHSLRRGAAEAIEIIAHGDAKTSKVVGRSLAEIKLPKGTNIGAIVRGDDVILVHSSTVIETNDHIVLFLVDRKHIPEVERLFQVNWTFF